MSDETTELGGGTLTADQVREAVLENFEETHETRYDHWEPSKFDWQAIADELNAELGSGKAKDLLLRTFGLAQMMHDCWLEECKAGDNVDVSACNAYSYEFDQIVQAMFDMGTDPNDSDYYRSAELGSGTCERTTTRNGKFKTKYGRKVPLCECCGYAIGDDRYNYCPKCGAKIVKAVKR